MGSLPAPARRRAIPPSLPARAGCAARTLPPHAEPRRALARVWTRSLQSGARAGWEGGGACSSPRPSLASISVAFIPVPLENILVKFAAWSSRVKQR